MKNNNVEAREVVAMKELEKKQEKNKQPEQPVIVIKNRHIVRHVLEIGILLPLILLVLRRVVPGIVEEIPNVYRFLDAVVIPVVEWFYKLLMKCYAWLMEQPWFKSIIDWFANLAV